VTDEAVLTGFQLADSFLPVGSYSCSYALEQFVQSGRVEDGADLEALLGTYLGRQIGPGELVALRAAHRSAVAGDVDGVLAADERLHAVTLPAEFRESSARSGRRLCDLRRQTDEAGLLEAYAARDPPQQYPVVLGAAAARGGLGERRACLLHCYSFLSDMLGAAQRLLSLGHTEAQSILEASKPAASEAVEASADRSLEEMSPFAPLVDLQAADHERADRRLFVS
jgi:urease accessory protein